jgi:hypothetical protein
VEIGCKVRIEFTRYNNCKSIYNQIIIPKFCTDSFLVKLISMSAIRWKSFSWDQNRSKYKSRPNNLAGASIYAAAAKWNAMRVSLAFMGELSKKFEGARGKRVRGFTHHISYPYSYPWRLWRRGRFVCSSPPRRPSRRSRAANANVSS